MSQLKKLLFSKYFTSCISYALSVSSALAIRVTLVFLMVDVFGSNDISKFSTYASFTIIADLSAILASYISNKFIKARISCLSAFGLTFLGLIIILRSMLSKDIQIFYLGMSIVSICSGILRCNFFVINSTYLQNEIKEHHNDYGSILHFITVCTFFIVIFSSGTIIKNNIIFIIFLCFALLIVSFVMFILNEYKNIQLELMELSNEKYFQNIIYSIALIVSAVIASFTFFSFSHIKIINNLPLLVFAGFYGYLIIRMYKNPNERKYILYAMLFAILMIFYCSLERQRDTVLALFLARNIINVNSVVTALQINSLFSIFILIFSIMLFKYKIHSKLSNIRIFFIIALNVTISFFVIYLGCKASDHDGYVQLPYYIWSMLHMAICNIFIYTKFIGVCRVMPDELKSTMSSFMIMNMGIAFYLSKILSSFAAIDNENTNKLYSLKIYQDHFLHIVIIGVIFIISLTIFAKTKYRHIVSIDNGS